ncbi:MAG: hypothetical protein JO199_14860 [Candidatus Eremiobacteraeota bacterium]|nr:hypothetical protein [Candidatus Eremiobacteraeota bacterium]
MINSYRLLAGAAALALAVGLPATALAQAPEQQPAPQKSHAPHVTMPHPISINGCNPKPPQTTWVSTGFAPAYYPVGVGPYWGWPSVYGPSYYSAQPIQSNPSLGIDYKNDTNVTMKEIEFGLVVNGNLIAEARDVGTFSPGAEIKHVFGLSASVFPLNNGMPQCVPLKITFDDGEKWKNPHLPALRNQLYGHPNAHY